MDAVFSSSSSPPGTLFLEKVIAEYQLDASFRHARMEGFAAVTPLAIALVPFHHDHLHGNGSYTIHYKWSDVHFVESLLVSPHDAGNIFPKSMRSSNSRKSASRIVFHMWKKNGEDQQEKVSMIFLSLWIPSDRSPLLDYITRAMHIYSIRSLLGLKEVTETSARAQSDLSHCEDALHEILHARSLFLKRTSESSSSNIDDAHLQCASSLRACSRVLSEIAEEGLLLSRSHREAFFSSSLPALLADAISNEIAAAEQTAKAAIKILSGKSLNKAVHPPSLIALQVARFLFIKSALSMLHFGCLDSDGMYGRRQLLSDAVLPGLLKSTSSDPSAILEICLQLAAYSPTKDAVARKKTLTSLSLLSSTLLTQFEQEAEEDESHLGILRADGVPVIYGSLSAKEAHSLGLPLPSRVLSQIAPFLDPYAEGLTTPGGLSASIRTRFVNHQQKQLGSSTNSTMLERSSSQLAQSSMSNTTKVSNSGIIHLPTINHAIGAHHHSVRPFDYSQVDLGRVDVQAAIQKHASGLFEGRLEALDLADKDISPSSPTMQSSSSSYYPRPSSPELIGHQKAIGLRSGGVLELPLHMPAGLAFRTMHERRTAESISSPIYPQDLVIPNEDDGGQRSTPLKAENPLKASLTDDLTKTGTTRSSLGSPLQRHFTVSSLPMTNTEQAGDSTLETTASHLAFEGRSTVIEIKEISVSLLLALAPILSLKGSSDKSRGPLERSYLKHGHDSSSTSRMMNHRISTQATRENWATENLHPQLHLPYKGEELFSSSENGNDRDDESKADQHDKDIGEVIDDHEFDDVRYYSSSVLSTSVISSNDVGIGDVLMNQVGDGHKLASSLALRVANTIAKLLDVAGKAKSCQVAFVESMKKSTTTTTTASNTLSLSFAATNVTTSAPPYNERMPYSDSYQSTAENAVSENERIYRNPAKFAVRLLTYSSFLDLLMTSSRMRQLVGKDIFKLLRLRCLKEHLEVVLHFREPVLAMAARKLQSVVESLSVWVRIEVHS